MGYTLYWKITKIPTQAAVNKVLSEIPIIKALSGSTQLTADFENPNIPPVFNSHKIHFNGTHGDAHEDFFIDFKSTTNFNFCKTARKPYDFVASLVLISCANNIEGFTFSSDEGK